MRTHRALDDIGLHRGVEGRAHSRCAHRSGRRREPESLGSQREERHGDEAVGVSDGSSATSGEGGDEAPKPRVVWGAALPVRGDCYCERYGAGLRDMIEEEE